VETEIPIDYDTAGRQLQYAYGGPGDSDVPLD